MSHARYSPRRLLILFVLAGGLLRGGLGKDSADADSTEAVGKTTANRYVIPTNQVLTPAGKTVDLPEMRPQALALSPDGRLLATSGKTKELVIVEPTTGEILQRVAFPAEPTAAGSGVPKGTKAGPEPGSQLSLTGLAFSPDGSRIFLSNVTGNVKVFAVDKDHRVAGLATLPVPEARTSKRKNEIPAGLACSDDGKRLYVVGNLGNQLHELDADSGKVLRSWPTGVAPFAVVLAAGKAYVSNSGGRLPGPGDLVAPAGGGTEVRVDAVRNIASEGSVTVIDLATGKVKAEVAVELHASAMAISPGGRWLAVANTGSDTISVIDTKTDRVIEKIWARQTPADLFGAQPNALAFDAQGKRLFVCNGTQNAVAVIKFEPEENESKVAGMIPVAWFPGAIEFDARRGALYVANIKGIGSAKSFGPEDTVKLSTKDFFGTLSLIPTPSEKELASMTGLTLQNMRYGKLAEARLPARPGVAPRPVPERVGEPSVFKHVIYVIKENRTYDQILGDLPEGNGNAALCTFGEKFTPNQHKLAREFVLLDNTYCSGVQSADGHQWTDSAIANAYMERQVTSAFPRSYPGGKSPDGVDALAWASSGFIWDNALAHGKTFRNYGEWLLTEAGWRDESRKSKPAWQDFWSDFQTGSGGTRLASRPAIESLRKNSKLDSVGWDLNVPDVVRAAEFIKELKDFEKSGKLPELCLVFLPNDHTGGTRGNSPTPGAQVADNDLAFGRLVEAVSHSVFWADTCIVAIEDDPQNGWDHVSGYRTTCYVASAYTKRRQTIHTQYNQTSVMRTIELILGLPPMNQLDATATPMSDCFAEQPELTPFSAVPNQVPLDELNPAPKKIGNRKLRQDALASARLPLDEPDRCPDALLNGILWRAMKGPDAPFPRWAVKLADDD
jgi:YVTN family beta-propeller protein